MVPYFNCIMNLINTNLDNPLYLNTICIHCPITKPSTKKCLNPNCNNLTNHHTGYCSNSCCLICNSEE